MLLEINDFVLCLGVGKASGVLNAHLFRLKDPINLITRQWQTGEEFSTGKWYKANKSKKYEQIDDIVWTMVIQKIDLTGNSQKTMLELILPVLFPPDLSSLKQYGQVPVLPNRNAVIVPICPLFGPENVEYLPVRWDQEQIGLYSDQLYGLKINLSYTIGSSPQWTHLISSQLKPWDYEEYGIVKQLCMESREEGLLLDGICPVHYMKNSPTICFMLNKQAELAIAICGSDRKKGSEFREYWPIRLGIYDPPVIIALDFPQSKQNFKNDLTVRKLARTNLQFEIVYTGKENLLENLTNFPWLGNITDQFAYLLDAQVKNETFTTMQATMVFSLEKRSVAWVVVGIKDQSTPKMDENDLLNGEMEDNWHLLKNIRELEEPRMDKKLVTSSSSSNLNIAATSSNSIASSRKFAIAVYMTNRSDGDAVFLFWNSNAKLFNQICYAHFHNSLKFNEEFGKWFELEYLEHPYISHRIIVLDFRETREYVVTRVRDGLCAQFRFPLRLISGWHRIYPCEVTGVNKNNFVVDNGWWPWLCRKCYPSLREEKEEQKMEEDSKNFLEDMAKRMHKSLASEEGTSTSTKEKSSESTTENGMAKKEHIPIQKQSMSVDGLTTTTVLAVLFSVRDTNGDAVFFIYDEYKNAFTHRIYGEPPEKIVGNPSIGCWYWLKFESNIAFQDGFKINIIEVQNLIGKPPVQTRVKYDGIAQEFDKQLESTNIEEDNSLIVPFPPIPLKIAFPLLDAMHTLSTDMEKKSAVLQISNEIIAKDDRRNENDLEICQQNLRGLHYDYKMKIFISHISKQLEFRLQTMTMEVNKSLKSRKLYGPIPLYVFDWLKAQLGELLKSSSNQQEQNSCQVEPLEFKEVNKNEPIAYKERDNKISEKLIQLEIEHYRVEGESQDRIMKIEFHQGRSGKKFIHIVQRFAREGGIPDYLNFSKILVPEDAYAYPFLDAMRTMSNELQEKRPTLSEKISHR